MMNDIETEPLADLMARAAARRDAAHGRLVSYSRKVFIPLTKLCRDVCHYCTFAERPRAERPSRDCSMPNKMRIDATHPEETRVVVLRGHRVEEFDFESANRKQLRGNIYLAKVTRVEPSLQAAFVDYGGNRHGFLAFGEIHPDYYQIPVADREALMREEAEEEDDNHEPRGRRSDLQGTQPRGMIPQHFVEVPTFPRNPKGKIDRPALARRVRLSGEPPGSGDEKGRTGNPSIQ